MSVNVLSEAEQIHEKVRDPQIEALALSAIQLVYLTSEVEQARRAVGEISGFTLKIKEALEKK